MHTIRWILVAAIALGMGAQQQQSLPRGGAEQIYVTAIEVVADVRDARGRVPAGLKPDDFILLEDGVRRPVISVEYLRSERIAATTASTSSPSRRASTQLAEPETLWQTVLYFETILSNGSGRIRAAEEMMKHVDTLVQMGTVDVVFANPSPVALVHNTRDAAAVRAALKKVASNMSVNQLAALRRDFLRDMRAVDSLNAMTTTAAELEYASAGELRQYIDQETQLIQSFRDHLLSWISSYRRHVPRNLLMVTDGFDIDPVEFYASITSSAEQMDLRSYVNSSTMTESANRLSKALAAGAWTAISIPSNNNSDGWVDDATTSGIGRMHGTLNQKPRTAPKNFLYRPLDPLLRIAEDTGGKVVANSSRIGSTIETLDDRIKLTYQVDRKPDAKLRPIEVRPRDVRLKVRAARFATSSTPEEIAETRALNLLRSPAYEGDLRLQAAMEWAAPSPAKRSGVLRAVADADLAKLLLPEGAKGQFRLTVAVRLPKEAVVVNRMVPDYDLASGVFRMRAPLDIPHGARAMVVVVEETVTGLWGSTRINIPAEG